MIDSIIVRAHQQAATGKGGCEPSAGALPRRIDDQVHMIADTLGRPLRFILTAGQTHDITVAPALLEDQTAANVLADKAYGCNALRTQIAAMGAEAVIPSSRSQKVATPHDRDVYVHRNRIERCFNRLKHFRRFATRSDRHPARFLGFVHLAAATI